ncbi:MAG: hypothetical protein ACF8LK_01470 [Phycisphaerales bacterium JB041]
MRTEEPLLEQDALKTLLHLRGALGDLFAGLSMPLERASQLQEALGIDKKLAWRIHSFLNEADVLAASKHLPSSAGMEIVFGAATDRGADPAHAAEAGAAFDAFVRVAKSHAGGRPMMEMMLASTSPRALRDAARTHQRNAFKANSFIWGVQARLQLSTLILHPSAADPDRVDIAAVRGLAGLRRLRANVPWVIGRVRCIDDDGEIRMPLHLTPIDPQPKGADGLPPVPLLREFCSKPLPELRRVPGGDRHLEDELVDGPIGNAGAVDCFTGELAAGAGTRCRNEHNQIADLAIRVRTPLQWLLVDVFTHVDVSPVETPSLGVYSDVSGTGASTNRPERDRLIVDSEVQSLGRGTDSVFTPHLAQYPRIVDHVFGSLAWDRSEFAHYRVLIEHPVMPSTVHVRWPLPECG